jgi:glutathione S-transferase
MGLRLFVVHGSHPCAAVEQALTLKGLRYDVTEWPPPLHPVLQMALFGRRTVPALRNGAEKVVGSRAIMHRLDEMVPEPPLYPADPELRRRVEEADRWGDQEFQQVARDLVWAGIVHDPDALVSYGEHSRIPLPDFAVRLSAPLIAHGAAFLNHTGDEQARSRLRELPAQLQRIDAWIEDGTIGDLGHPSAADLQVFSTVRLLTTIGDAGAALDGTRAAALAQQLFPQWDGSLPAGSIPAAG